MELGRPVRPCRNRCYPEEFGVERVEEVSKVTQGIEKDPLEPGYANVTNRDWERHPARR